MRYRVKKDFVLDGALLAIGDSLYIQQATEQNKWEVYSLFTRKLVKIMTKEEIEEVFYEDGSTPKDKFIRKGGKSIKDIGLILILFTLPLGAISQNIVNIQPMEHTGKDPVKWYTKMVQTADDMFELHVSAKIDSNSFLYLLNDRKRCELCPVLMLEPSPFWTAIEGPDIYYYGNKIPPDRCGSLPSPYCPVVRFTDSVVYIQVIQSKAGRNCSVKGHIQYYPTYLDSTGQSKTLMFARSLYSTSEQPITKITNQ
jgi:hypothetical protein